MAPTNVSTMALKRIWWPRNSSGISVSEVLDDLDPVVAGGLVAEGVHVGRQVEVVVDRLGNVDHPDTPLGLLHQFHGRVRRVVAADRDQARDVQVQERDH
jgi:hypothetical protein